MAASASQSQPVSSVQLVAWLASGMSSGRLVRLVRERGIASVPGKTEIRELESAGADANLVRTLTSLKPSDGSRIFNNATAEIPADLIQAAPMRARNASIRRNLVCGRR